MTTRRKLADMYRGPLEGMGPAEAASVGGLQQFVSTATRGQLVGQNWERDKFSDTFTYTYKCGHQYRVAGNRMQAGGQVAPPVCPACNDRSVIDKIEAEQWRQDPRWSGFAVGDVVVSEGVPMRVVPVMSGPIAWLDYQIGTVREKAWR